MEGRSTLLNPKIKSHSPNASVAKLVDLCFTMHIEMLNDRHFKTFQELKLNEIESKSTYAIESTNIKVKLSKI